MESEVSRKPDSELEALDRLPAALCSASNRFLVLLEIALSS